MDCSGITHLNIRYTGINLLLRVPDSLPTTCWIWARPVELTSLLARSCPRDFNNWQQFSNISFGEAFFCNSKSKRSQNHLWLRPSLCLLQQAIFQATTQSNAVSLSAFLLCFIYFSFIYFFPVLIFVFCVLKEEAVTPEALSDQKLLAAAGGQHLHKKGFLNSQVKMRAERLRRGLNGASQHYVLLWNTEGFIIDSHF